MNIVAVELTAAAVKFVALSRSSSASRRTPRSASRTPASSPKTPTTCRRTMTARACGRRLACCRQTPAATSASRSSTPASRRRGPDGPHLRVLRLHHHGRGGGRGAVGRYGHGTHIAGLIAGSGANSNGKYIGMATAARSIGLKVLDAKGSGFTSDVIAAIDFATNNKAALGIDVINLSLGHPIYEPAATDPMVQAVERAVAPASLSSSRPATSAWTRRPIKSATRASPRPAMRRPR